MVVVLHRGRVRRRPKVNQVEEDGEDEDGWQHRQPIRAVWEGHDIIVGTLAAQRGWAGSSEHVDSHARHNQWLSARQKTVGGGLLSLPHRRTRRRVQTGR
jgi:hypothetical protein